MQGKEASASFLKKRSKKLSLLRALAKAGPQPAVSRSFFASPGGAPFFSKKEALT
jgi:hypothetical protein